jgi:hypothetical protein
MYGRIVVTAALLASGGTTLTGTSEDVPYSERVGRIFRCATRRHGVGRIFRCATVRHGVGRIFRCATVRHGVGRIFRCAISHQN